MSTKLLACLLLPKTLLLLLLPLAPAALADDGIPNWPGLTWAMSLERLDSVGSVEQVSPDQQTVHKNRCRGRHTVSNVLHLDVQFTRASFCDHEGKLLAIDLVQRGPSKEELQGGYDVIHHALLGQFGGPRPDRKSNRATWESGGTRIDLELHDDPASRRSFLTLSYSPRDYQGRMDAIRPEAAERAELQNGYNATPSADVLGWNGILWLANHEELRAKLPAEPEEARMQPHMGGLFCYKHWYLNDVAYLGRKFNVQLCDGNHRLLKVELNASYPEGLADQELRTTQHAFLMEFGRPEFLPGDRWRWQFPTTTIEASFHGRGAHIIFSPTNPKEAKLKSEAMPSGN